jgi:hypothetical protein
MIIINNKKKDRLKIGIFIEMKGSTNYERY